MNINAIKIETLLAERGMTKKDLAGECGISRQNISTIVRRGTCEPKTAGKLAAGLGVLVTDIMELYAAIQMRDHRPVQNWDVAGG